MAIKRFGRSAAFGAGLLHRGMSVTRASFVAHFSPRDPVVERNVASNGDTGNARSPLGTAAVDSALSDRGEAGGHQPRSEADMLTRKITVIATWDDEAKVWSARSDDLYGLATEADTFEQLRQILDEVLPDLIAANGIPGEPAGPELPVFIMAEALRPVRVADA